MCCSFNKIYIGSRQIAHFSLAYFEKQIYQSTQANIFLLIIKLIHTSRMKKRAGQISTPPAPQSLYLRKHRFLYRICLYAINLTNGQLPPTTAFRGRRLLGENLVALVRGGEAEFSLGGGKPESCSSLAGGRAWPSERRPREDCCPGSRLLREFLLGDWGWISQASHPACCSVCILFCKVLK